MNIRLPIAALVAAVLGAACPLAAQETAADEPRDLYAVVTALGEGAQVRLADVVVSRPGDNPLLLESEPIRITVVAREAAQIAAIQISAADATLVLNNVEIDIHVRKDGGLALKLAGESQGEWWLDVYHGIESPALQIQVGDAVLSLPVGAVRISSTDQPDRVRVRVATGRITGQSAAGQIALDATDRNETIIRGDAFGAAGRAEGTIQDQAAARGSIVQRSLLPDLVRVAEAAAEGDIEPPTRASTVQARAVAPEVRVAEIVPRGGVISTLVSGAGQSAVFAGAGGAATQAEAFLSSGQAAQAVVGARLQRTRFTASRTGTSFAISQEFSQFLVIGRPAQ